MWEKPRRDTGPVYVAAALEWVKIGPKLQGRRAICCAFKLSILNFSADWQNAKYCYCTVRCGVVWCVVWPNTSYCTLRRCIICCYGTEQLQGKRETDTVVQFLCLFGEGIGCHSLFCSEQFLCLQFCALLVQMTCSWRSGAPVFCPTALRIIH